jgi:hypothetical protein
MFASSTETINWLLHCSQNNALSYPLILFFLA